MSLVEVLVGLVVFATGVLGLAGAELWAGVTMKEAMERARALDAARDWIAYLAAHRDDRSALLAVRLGDAPTGMTCSGEAWRSGCAAEQWKCRFMRWRERCTAIDGLAPIDGGVVDEGGPTVIVRYGEALGDDGSSSPREIRLPLGER